MSNLQHVNQIVVVGFAGSLREDGYTEKTVKLALEGAQQLGAQTKYIDLKELNLPFCNQNRGSENDNLDLKKLKELVKEAHGIVLGSPEYHGSFSGVIKNALDLMGFQEFEGKVIGLVGVSGGSLGAINALNGLRMIGRQLHAWVIPHQASIPRARDAFDQYGSLKDDKLQERVKKVGEDIAKFAVLHNSFKEAEFVKSWEKAPLNPGA